jgi:hypothetical protein
MNGSDKEIVLRVRLLYGDEEAGELERIIKGETEIYWFD